MKLREEVALRHVIRSLIETVKIGSGWEDYVRYGDNTAIDPGYRAAYYEQYADSTMSLDRTSELEAGGENVAARRRARRKKAS